MKRSPKLMIFGRPVWFNRYGDGLRVTYQDGSLLKISSNSVEITIRMSGHGNGLWRVGWTLKHGALFRVEGVLHVSSELLAAMFGRGQLSRQTRATLVNERLTRATGAFYVMPGVCCRWRQYVTFPNVGTGLANDSNVSIECDRTIVRAVRAQIRNRERREKLEQTAA